MTGDEIPRRTAALIHDYLKANVRAAFEGGRAVLYLRNPQTGEWERVKDHHEEQP